MRVYVSVCSLLVSVLGLLAGADPIRTQFQNNVLENHVGADENAVGKEIGIGMFRFEQEKKVFPKGLHVYNDDGELVEVSLTDDTEDDETEEETRSKLTNRVSFRLYTRENPAVHQQLWINDKQALAASNFNANRPTRFITHGWVNTGNSPACALIRDAYLIKDDYNVIVVDWGSITLRPYVWVTRRVVMVGQFVASMIDFLEKNANLDTTMTTLVGHSLGAHVMGLAGFYSKGTINYVVGLDPALPMFVFAGPGSRISLQDASHVEIIHTNAGLLGYLEAIGHSDFYPNGGSRQLGCLLDIGGACSHARSYQFYAESINSLKGFYGKQCKSYIQFITGFCKTQNVGIMGGPKNVFAKPGKYFLATRGLAPFAKGR